MADFIKPLSVATTQVREDRFYARLDEGQVHQLLTRAVAQAAGLDPDMPGLKVTKCWVSRNDKGSRIETSAEVELVIARGSAES